MQDIRNTDDTGIAGVTATVGASSARRTRLRQRGAACLLVAIMGTATAPKLAAFPNGVHSSSFSAATGCNQCHSGGATPTVSILGPSAMAVGSSRIFTLRIDSSSSAQQGGGINVSRSGSSSLSETSSLLKLITDNGEVDITHIEPISIGTGAFDLDFALITNPNAVCNTTVTLTGWGLASNFDGTVAGDKAASATKTVTHVCPAEVVTSASPGIVIGAGTVSDSATVNGRTNPVAGATIDFRLYGPDDEDCSGTPAFESLDVPYPAGGGAVSSAAFTPTKPGTYRWRAFYSGDANNVASSGACNDPGETVVVSRATPTITTMASPSSIVLGAGQVRDTAVVTGRFNPPLFNATVVFRLYGPNDPLCLIPIFESSPVGYPQSGGMVTSGPYTPLVAGTYRWRATYNGDTYNNPVTGACNAENESVEVLLGGGIFSDGFEG